MREGAESKFPLLPQRFGSFQESFWVQDGLIKCVWSVCRWLSQWWLVFVLLRFMLLQVMDVEFENTCTVSRKCSVSRVIPVIPRFVGMVYKVLRLPQSLVELWVPNQGYSQSASSQWVVITAGSQLEGQLESYR